MTRTYRTLTALLALGAFTLSTPVLAGGWKAALEMNAKIRAEAHAVEGQIAGEAKAEKKCELAKQASYKMREARGFSEIAVQAAAADPHATSKRRNHIRAVHLQTTAEEQTSKNLVVQLCPAAG